MKPTLPISTRRSHVLTSERLSASTPFASQSGPQPSTFNPQQFSSAFSLIEVMVTVTLLSFIILGLLLMFNQVQRAFRAGMSQTDVLEGGRAAMDLLVRELEHITPSQGPQMNTAFGNSLSFNFSSELDTNFNRPLVQALPGSNFKRTNIVQRSFFLTRLNQDWIGVGYVVLPDPNSLAGPLYRFCQTNRYSPAELRPTFLSILNQPVERARTNLSHVADGVVHFRLHPYDTNGVPLTTRFRSGTLYSALPTPPPYCYVTNSFGMLRFTPDGFMLDQLDSYFWSNAVPASVELELGILEPKVFQRYKAIDPGIAEANARAYLSDRAAQVHVFRQRIPVRTVDFKAYQ